MARPKFKLTNAHLKNAWRWKKKGLPIGEICEKIKITPSQYAQNRQAFNACFKRFGNEEQFCQQRELRNDSKNSYRDGGTKLKIGDIDLKALESYVIAGFNRETIANMLGISRGTLVNYAKKFPEINDVLVNAKNKVSAKVIGSVIKSATGYSHRDVHISNFLGDITVTPFRKRYKPDPAMAKMWLVNNMAWRHEPKQNIENSKGLILEALQKLTEE